MGCPVKLFADVGKNKFLFQKKSENFCKQINTHHAVSSSSSSSCNNQSNGQSEAPSKLLKRTKKKSYQTNANKIDTDKPWVTKPFHTPVQTGQQEAYCREVSRPSHRVRK